LRWPSFKESKSNEISMREVYQISD